MKRIVKLPAPPMDKDGNPISGYVALGGGYCDVDDRAALPQGAESLTSGAARYTSLSDTHKPQVMLARVYRNKDGSSLRAEANTAKGGSLPSKVPATGKTSSKPTAEQKPEDVRDRAREQHAKGFADRLHIRMSEVRTGDVVTEDTLVPHRWMGEEN